MTAIFNLDKSHSISNIVVVTKIWNNSMEVLGLTVDLKNKKKSCQVYFMSTELVVLCPAIHNPQWRTERLVGYSCTVMLNLHSCTYKVHISPTLNGSLPLCASNVAMLLKYTTEYFTRDCHIHNDIKVGCSE